MGQSTPTTTMALEEFERRYGDFRAELPPEGKRRLDLLVCWARRHSSAINRRPDLDFERPAFLAMLLETQAALEAERAERLAVQRQLEEVCRVLAEDGKLRRRPPTRTQLARAGQSLLAA